MAAKSAAHDFKTKLRCVEALASEEASTWRARLAAADAELAMCHDELASVCALRECVCAIAACTQVTAAACTQVRDELQCGQENHAATENRLRECQAKLGDERQASKHTFVHACMHTPTNACTHTGNDGEVRADRGVGKCCATGAAEDR